MLKIIFIGVCLNASNKMYKTYFYPQNKNASEYHPIFTNGRRYTFESLKSKILDVFAWVFGKTS